jgi:hypothetical protein
MGDFILSSPQVTAMRIFLLLILLVHNALNAQVIGGNTAFSFINLPSSAQASAFGSVNVSNITNDITLHVQNPALLTQPMHGQLSISFNNMYAGVKHYSINAGLYSSLLKTSFAFHINDIDYGEVPETDAAGNVFGNFRPNDYLIQVTASKKYLEKWHYAMAIQFIHSAYGNYRSSAVALDVGATYYDSAKQFKAGLVMKHMGFAIKQYVDGVDEKMPFDIQIGITKRLAKAPLQFSLTAYHLSTFDTQYNDTAFNNSNSFANASSKKITFEKLIQHFVIGAQVYVAEKIELTGGYNFLRRKELNIPNTANSLNGFSIGVGVLFKKFQFRYARSYYQNNRAYNQFGVNLPLNEIGR